MTERAIVVGAGPAGLAAAAELRRRGIPAVVLERGDRVGAAWQTRYDRLRLNSSRWFSQLPGARFGRGAGVFPSREEMVGYLRRYAERHEIDVRLRTPVERIDGEGGRWVLRTPAGDHVADHVIVAAGHQHTGRIPDWPGRERFGGPLLHAADYRNPEPFAGRDVLVVGPGSSGMEIAYDLATGGASRVRLAVRTPPNIILRSPVGPLLARIFMRAPAHRADAMMRRVRAQQLGDLEPYGLPTPEEGLFARHHRLGVAPAIVDPEWIDAITDGRIEVVAGVESLDEAGVVLADGARIEPDAIVAATGYRTALEPMVGHLGVLDERGVPHVPSGDEAAPGLRFVGYHPRPALLGYLGGEARTAVKGIAAQRRGATRTPRPMRRPAVDTR